MSECFFCQLIEGKHDRWIVYEDEKHLGFLTPFPNTPGFTVLVTKEHHDSDVLLMNEARYSEFLSSAKQAAASIRQALGVKRVGLIIEGMGINHAHIKLIPMHGIPDGLWQPVLSTEHPFSEIYTGSLSTHDGPRMSNEELTAIQAKFKQ